MRKIEESNSDRIGGVFMNPTGNYHVPVKYFLEKNGFSGLVYLVDARRTVHLRNPQKRYSKLKETRGRQRNRIRDEDSLCISSLIKEHPDSSFILEDLRNIRRTSEPKSKKLRTYLNRWPYNQFQKMLEYKSHYKTIYVNPEGTSSECPLCGGKVKHPAWKISRCENCGLDYDRDRLASLAISLRGLDLCGDPFPVSAIASVPSRMDEYLYTRNQPEISGADGTEMAYASNDVVHNNT